MIYKGYKIRVRCIDWEQTVLLGDYWDTIASYVDSEKIVGLGMNWTKDYIYFDYALGIINDDATLKILNKINFSKTKFQPEYFELELPEIHEWKIFKGKDNDIKNIYDNYIDVDNKKYDYELEYIDDKGNIEIKIHYI